MIDTGTNTLPVWFVVIAWAAFSRILNVLGVIATPSDKPPLPLLISVIGPPILFVIAYSCSEKVRTLSLSLDLRLLTAMQAWRVIGAMFLVLMSFGFCQVHLRCPQGSVISSWVHMLHLWFSRYRADLRVGRSTLSCSMFLAYLTSSVPSAVACSAVARPLGILRGEVTTDIMQKLPLSMIPTFAVPFWIIISLIKLRNLQAAAEESGR
jgi:hypothetical protein